LKRNALLVAGMIGVLIFQFVLLNVDRNASNELSRFNTESGTRRLLAEGFTQQQAAAVASLVANAELDASYHTRSIATYIGGTAFMLAMLALVGSMKEKS